LVLRIALSSAEELAGASNTGWSMLNNMQENSVKSAFVLGAFIFFGLTALGFFVGSSLIKFKEYERTVTVKGLSEKEYPADIALWPIQFISSNNDLTKLYESIENDANESKARSIFDKR
jgi:uncharacterized protein